MGTLNYVTGNPGNLTAGATASMVDISGPFQDIRTWANGNVDSSNTTPGPVLLATQQGWQTIAVSTPLFGVNWTGNWQWYKDSLGVVTVRGRVVASSGNLGSGTSTWFTLPAGSRPGVAVPVMLMAWDGTQYGNYPTVEVATTGVVSLQRLNYGAFTTFDIGQIQFKAEN